MKPYHLTIIILILFSCSQKEDKMSLSEQLIGEWRNTYMKVEMSSVNNSDSANVLEVTEENWEEKLKIRTIQTTYRANGTYNSKHLNLKDSIIYNPAGNWSIIGDSLIMVDTFPQKGITYKAKMKITENVISSIANRYVKQGTELIAEFWLIVDFDQDGKTDDYYYSKQRKQ